LVATNPIVLQVFFTSAVDFLNRHFFTVIKEHFETFDGAARDFGCRGDLSPTAVRWL
jgi:hypothetical protein